MKVVTEQEARTQLSELADATWDNHDVVVIAREGGRSTVMLSLEDYESLNETAYLLRSPANAERLLQSVNDVRLGINLQEHELIEP
jgi:antitoxin YefM